jgi:hypothetical protein
MRKITVRKFLRLALSMALLVEPAPAFHASSRGQSACPTPRFFETEALANVSMMRRSENRISTHASVKIVKEIGKLKIQYEQLERQSWSETGPMEHWSLRLRKLERLLFESHSQIRKNRDFFIRTFDAMLSPNTRDALERRMAQASDTQMWILRLLRISELVIDRYDDLSDVRVALRYGRSFTQKLAFKRIVNDHHASPLKSLFSELNIEDAETVYSAGNSLDSYVVERLFWRCLSDLWRSTKANQLRPLFDWLDEKAIPLLRPIAPGWFAAINCGVDIVSAAYCRTFAKNHDAYIAKGELLAEASPRAGDYIVGNQGIHLRSKFDADIDALDLRTLNHQIPLMRRPPTRRGDLVRRDRALLQGLYFSEVNRLMGYLTENSFQALEELLGDIVTRRGRKMLLTRPRHANVYEATKSWDDPKTLARYNLTHGTNIRFLNLITGVQRAVRQLESELEFRSRQEMAPAIRWLETMLDNPASLAQLLPPRSA